MEISVARAWMDASSFHMQQKTRKRKIVELPRTSEVGHTLPSPALRVRFRSSLALPRQARYHVLSTLEQPYKEIHVENSGLLPTVM